MENRESSQNSQSVADFDAQTNPLIEEKAGALAALDKEKVSNDTHEAIEDEISPQRGLLRRRLPIILAGVVLGTAAVVSSVYGYRWWLYSQQFKVTDNAYVAAGMYQVEPQVIGLVTSVNVAPNQEIKPGTALVKVDPREYQADVNGAKAALDSAKQQVELARQRLDALANISSATEPIAEGQPANAPNNVVFPNLSQQRDLIQQQLQANQAAVKQKEAELKQAELKLANTNILASTEGRVSNIAVQVGQRIQPGQSLMTIVKPNPWIIANFQENQFEKIQPGQPATIKINAFPSRTFKGSVDGMVSTIANPTNTSEEPNKPAIKRIPFKINLDAASLKGYESRITPQMSAVVTVNTKPKK